MCFNLTSNVSILSEGILAWQTFGRLGVVGDVTLSRESSKKNCNSPSILIPNKTNRNKQQKNIQHLSPL